MGKYLALLALIVLASSAFAVRVQNLEIIAAVDQNGSAEFTENYGLAFSSPFEFADFKQKIRKDIPSLGAVQADYNFFYPHFLRGTDARLAGSEMTFDERAGVFTLKYTLSKRFASVSSEGQRATFFEIGTKPFAGFIEGASIVIPENTTVKVALPSGAEVDPASVLPQNSQFAGNVLTLRGLQTNAFRLLYRVVKPISPGGNDIFGGGNAYIIVTVLALAALVLYYKKDEIEKSVEDYIVAHSEIKARETEEELDFDL